MMGIVNMNDDSHRNNLSIHHVLETLSKKEQSGKTSLSEIVIQFHDIGFAVMMFLLSMPVAIPLPYPPGSTAIFGIPLLILSIQMIMGYREVRLPAMITNYKISNKKIIIFAEKAIVILPKIEKYIDLISSFVPKKHLYRYLYYVLKILLLPFIFLVRISVKDFFRAQKTTSYLFFAVVERLIGIISFICSICISSPIPFTHSLPAWGIAIMSLGLIKRDGLVIFLGAVVSAVGLFVSYGAVIMAISLLRS